MARYVLCCFFFFLVLLLPPPLSNAANISSDASALLAFKQSVAKSPKTLQSWSLSSVSQICSSWEGVSCSSSSTNSTSQRISQLRLPGKSLYGPIPPNTLGLLDSLDTLSLHSNKLSGSFPLDLANCILLRRLYLQDNRFSGPLPNTSSSWPLLMHLYLSFNNFSGPIPSSLATLTRLKILDLQNNSLSGNIPQLNISSLTNFSVANNQLSGPIPSSLAGFSKSSFAGNIGLCGAPLADCPPSPSSPPPLTPPQGTHDRDLSTGAIVSIAVGAAALLVSLLLLCFCLLCRGKQKDTQTNDNLFAAGRTEFERSRAATTTTDASKRDKAIAVPATREDSKKLIFFDNRRHTFELEDLLRASAEVLGKGNLGTSYKAALENGVVVAVKRLRDAVNDKDDYRQRIEILGRLSHDNLVPLRAYYFVTEEKLLVSDYMPNGSLSALLHGGKKPRMA